MKRLLVVDDERPVIEGVSLIVKRDLASEFELAGSASSGREAIDKAVALAPDIILMDVRMPGISGLEAIREIRSRGSNAVFILVTAYERFDIAREAVGLGVLDYLLKPVAKDKLSLSLRAAALFIERKAESERKEIEGREAEEGMRVFAETAFLHGLVLGQELGGELARYRRLLGLDEAYCLVGAALFLPPPASLDPRAVTAAQHERLTSLLRYKTRGLAGPLFHNRSAFLLPLREADEGPRARNDFQSIIRAGMEDELAQGLLHFGLSSPCRLETAAKGWLEAMLDLIGQGEGAEMRTPVSSPRAAEGGKPFEDEEAFLEEILDGSPERARLPLERLLSPIASGEVQRPADFYRLVGLFGAAYRGLARRGLLPPEEAALALDAEDLRRAWEGGQLAEALRDRFSRLAEGMGRVPRWSQPVARTIAFIQDNYGGQIGLELAADAVGLSPGRLSRLFVEETGRGFSDYLIDYRIEKAKEALRVPGSSIKQVSISCGYPDPNYFSRLFKKVTGLTPSAFSMGALESTDEE
jgi:two-component system response regulator YesN